MAAYKPMTDTLWGMIKPLLPPQPARGRRYKDLRRKTNGIFYLVRAGCRYCDIPRYYGDDSSVYRWFKRLLDTGTFQKIFETLLSTLDEQGKLEWSQAKLDGSFAPAKRGVPTLLADTRAKVLQSIWSAMETDFR
jgi:transposase